MTLGLRGQVLKLPKRYSSEASIPWTVDFEEEEKLLFSQCSVFFRRPGRWFAGGGNLLHQRRPLTETTPGASQQRGSRWGWLTCGGEITILHPCARWTDPDGVAESLSLHFPYSLSPFLLHQSFTFALSLHFRVLSLPLSSLQLSHSPSLTLLSLSTVWLFSSHSLSVSLVTSL